MNLVTKLYHEQEIDRLQKFLRTLEKGGWADYCRGRYGVYSPETLGRGRRDILATIAYHEEKLQEGK